jgi:Fe-S cluster assembly ATP-binding protein
MLTIKELKAGVEDNQILKGINLEVKAGEVHAIMGPNGSGKSTLSAVIAGNESYEVEGGSIEFDGTDLLDLNPEERAHNGLFLSFQYPVEIPGISTGYCKDVLNQLPMEFAVEAQKLLEISLEGSVG